jgi:hypothetical protein
MINPLTRQKQKGSFFLSSVLLVTASGLLDLKNIRILSIFAVPFCMAQPVSKFTSTIENTGE